MKRVKLTNATADPEDEPHSATGTLFTHVQEVTVCEPHNVWHLEARFWQLSEVVVTGGVVVAEAEVPVDVVDVPVVVVPVVVPVVLVDAEVDVTVLEVDADADVTVLEVEPLVLGITLYTTVSPKFTL